MLFHLSISADVQGYPMVMMSGGNEVLYTSKVVKIVVCVAALIVLMSVLSLV